MTTDHFPPRIMFVLKQRPKGLEFPCCEACNSGSKGDEQVAAFLARLYPDPATQAEAGELEKLTDAIINNHPGLLEEMRPQPRHAMALHHNRERLPNEIHALNASGPLLNRAILRFAAKLCCAMRYHATGIFMPKKGAIEVRWMTNYQAIMGEYPESIHSIFELGSTIRQGTKHVGDQFRHSFKVRIDKRLSYHLGVFRESFAVYGIATDDVSLLTLDDGPNKMMRFRPGWLKGPRDTGNGLGRASLPVRF